MRVMPLVQIALVISLAGVSLSGAEPERSTAADHAAGDRQRRFARGDRRLQGDRRQGRVKPRGGGTGTSSRPSAIRSSVTPRRGRSTAHRERIPRPEGRSGPGNRAPG